MNGRILRAIVYALIPAAVILTGCADKYEEGFKAGYAQGSKDAELSVRAEFERKVRDLEREVSSNAHRYSAASSTEVCGGAGVNLNGKHYSGGKTGCVRVMSDGRVERF